MRVSVILIELYRLVSRMTFSLPTDGGRMSGLGLLSPRGYDDKTGVTFLQHKALKLNP